MSFPDHFRLLSAALLLGCAQGWAEEGPLGQRANTWVKRTPLAETPVSPRLGYEGACVWDNKHRVILRYGGHNQGGGGEQGSEVWTYEPLTAKWTLKEPNISPPGVCCDAQNVFDPVRGRYIRFPSFSGNHGWQWPRELYLNDASVWTYDLGENRWRKMHPLPAPRLVPLRCAAWDEHEEVALVFGGETGPRETVAYDPHRNEWRWMKPATQPEPRSGGQMAYDSARKVHVLFGSQFNQDARTWVYSFAENNWREAKPETAPPADKNDAVLTYDPLRKLVLAVVKISEGKEEAAKHTLETWSYDAGANQWKKLNPASEPEPSGSRARQLLFAPELGLAFLENCPSKPREQQIWSFRFEGGERAEAWKPVPPKARTEPRAVEEGSAAVISTTRVELRWKSAPNTRYLVERAVVEVASEDQLLRLKRITEPLAEPSVGAIRRIGAFETITQEPLDEASFVDNSIDLAKPATVTGEPVYERKFNLDQLDTAGRPYRYAVYAYRVRAVANGGAASGPSPPFFTIPSAPQGLFSREEGTTCHLKWEPNPEKGLKGYRVYRMDGRWDKDPVPRLTAEPLNDTKWKDEAAGKSTRRYYVIAVDALGQEGFPTSPVWFNREWKQYYRPFVGEWHQ